MKPNSRVEVSSNVPTGDDQPVPMSMPEQEAPKARRARIDPADIDDFATDDDIKTADNNILMQLRKSVSLRGLKDVKFNDNKKVKVNDKIAQAALNKFASIRTSGGRNYGTMRKCPATSSRGKLERGCEESIDPLRGRVAH